MRNRKLIILAIGALFLAAVAYRDSLGGNLQTQPIQYFSVELKDNEVLHYTGLEEETVILIDDITYSAWMEPTVSETHVGYFSQFDWSPQPPEWNFTILAGEYGDFHYTYWRRWAESGGSDFGAYLVENGGNGPEGIFDRFTHSTHAEFVGERDKEAFAQWQVFGTVDFGCGAGGAGGLGLGVGLGMGMWATPTSQSRHYQTPQIVAHGNYVAFVVEAPAPGSNAPTAYKRARCNIKGRIILSSQNPDFPVENADITVSPSGS